MDNRPARIGLAFFLATEVMFFAGLISAYWVLRAGVSPWPPPGQPRLPITVTGMNTLILLASGGAILLAERAVRKGCHLCFLGWIGITGLGGLSFLSLQGYEWIRLIRFGLQTVHNIYGGTFYLIVGAHALHLIAALLVLSVVFFKAVEGRYSDARYSGVTLCRIYWLFVVLVWPVLYALVYF